MTTKHVPATPTDEQALAIANMRFGHLGDPRYNDLIPLRFTVERVESSVSTLTTWDVVLTDNAFDHELIGIVCHDDSYDDDGLPWYAGEAHRVDDHIEVGCMIFMEVPK